MVTKAKPVRKKGETAVAVNASTFILCKSKTNFEEKKNFPEKQRINIILFHYVLDVVCFMFHLGCSIIRLGGFITIRLKNPTSKLVK